MLSTRVQTIEYPINHEQNPRIDPILTIVEPVFQSYPPVNQWSPITIRQKPPFFIVPVPSFHDLPMIFPLVFPLMVWEMCSMKSMKCPTIFPRFSQDVPFIFPESHGFFPSVPSASVVGHEPCRATRKRRRAWTMRPRKWRSRA